METSEELEAENLMVATLSTREAISIATMAGITVERDQILEGASEEEGVLESEGVSEEEDNSEEYMEAIEKTVQDAWDIKAVNVEENQDTKDVIKVAILDSGYDRFGSVECDGYEDFVETDEENAGDDYTGHGTAIASIIMSGSIEDSTEEGTQGIIEEESEIELYSVKVLDGNNQAPISRVIEGIQWCIDNEINIINMSFGTTYYSSILEDAVERAEKAGILMIASVGNTGETDGIVEYPAAFEEVVGVGSVNEKIERSVFSAVGEEVELAAPGENVPLTSYWGMITVGSGTSYAAPHVTAIAALLWARDGEKSNDSIRGLLQKSARDLGEKEEYGYGLVDYEYATEIYDEYMELYQEGGVENIDEEGVDGIKENDRSVMEYEVPEMVQGSWHGEKHYGQVEEVYEKKYVGASCII